jgi:beta-glucosidase
VRDTAGRFADYAEIVARAFGDRVEQFVLFEEPATFTRKGYWTGSHAPGRRDFDAFLRAGHSVNLAQADAFHAMKATRGTLQLGSAHRHAVCKAASDDELDRIAAERWQALWHDWHLLPAFAGRYPDAFEGGLPAERMGLRHDDLERIRVPLDWLGVNPGARQIVEHSAEDPLGLRLTGDSNAATTPEAICDSLLQLTRDYTRDEVKPIIEVTSNGWAEWADGEVPGADGELRDERRLRFHRQSLIALARATRQGVDLRGYHAWSLVDGFEWESGNEARTGLAWVDVESGTRRLKQSGRWFARAAAENGFAPENDE